VSCHSSESAHELAYERLSNFFGFLSGYALSLAAVI
jgi:hypothetical protein